MTACAVETEGLTKDYLAGFWRKRPRRALDNLSLQIRGGEIFGFLGPNGAGKSTTVKLLMGLIYPTSGSARILGCPPGDVAMRRRIGYLPEHPYFYDYLTGRELLDYFARLFGYPAAERRARVDRFLERVGLAAAGDVQLRKYSKGMLQRIGLAQALVHDPEVVVLDEPMSGLDPVGRREVRDLILDLRRAGRTVFFSTHILADAEMLCDRVGVLVAGRLRGVGAPQSIVGIAAQGYEILAELDGEPPAGLPGALTRTGERCSVEVADEDALYAALERLRGAHARILSVTQVKPTLEDFFLGLVRGEDSPPGPEASEVLR